jgi:hypothetical protein
MVLIKVFKHADQVAYMIMVFKWFGLVGVLEICSIMSHHSMKRCCKTKKFGGCTVVGQFMSESWSKSVKIQW